MNPTNTAESRSGENQLPPGDCGIPRECGRAVSGWLIALDNVPTLVMFGLGAALLGQVGWTWPVLYLTYCGLSIVWFWGRICPYCHHFDTRACPCGYGITAPRFFPRKEGKDFKQVFKRNIAVMFPCWFVPFGVGVYVLYSRFSPGLLALFLMFCVVGFALIPLIAKLVGCRQCDLKAECPWMEAG